MIQKKQPCRTRAVFQKTGQKLKYQTVSQPKISTMYGFEVKSLWGKYQACLTALSRIVK